MSDLFAVNEDFKELVKTVLNSEAVRNAPAGTIEVHIGYHEVEVNDTTDYSDSLICPYVHISTAGVSD